MYQLIVGSNKWLERYLEEVEKIEFEGIPPRMQDELIRERLEERVSRYDEMRYLDFCFAKFDFLYGKKLNDSRYDSFFRVLDDLYLNDDSYDMGDCSRQSLLEQLINTSDILSRSVEQNPELYCDYSGRLDEWCIDMRDTILDCNNLIFRLPYVIEGKNEVAEKIVYSSYVRGYGEAYIINKLKANNLYEFDDWQWRFDKTQFIDDIEKCAEEEARWLSDFTYEQEIRENKKWESYYAKYVE